MSGKYAPGPALGTGNILLNQYIKMDNDAKEI